MDRPPISGALTIFYYADLAAAAAWYEQVIGFERLLDLEGAVLFRVHEGSQLALIADGFGSQHSIPGTNKGAILSIETDALEAWLARLHAAGVAGANHGLQQGAGGRMLEFKVRDPGGYTIEFFRWTA